MALISLMSLLAAPASSQSAAPAKPSGGLFGATRSDVASGNQLNFMFEAGEGIASDVPAAIRSQVPQSSQSDGLSTLVSLSSDFAHTGRRVNLAATASSAVRYSHQLDRVDAQNYSAGVGANVRLPKQGRLRVDQTAAYSPSYLYQLFPVGDPPALGAGVPTNPEYQIEETESYVHGTRMALVFGSPRGMQLTTSGTLSRTDFREPTATRRNLEVRETGAKFDVAMSRRSAVSVGYQYRTGEFGFGGLTKEHRVTIGTEYSPALSRTRRATIRVELSPALVEIPPAFVEQISRGAESGVSTRLRRLNAEASISYPFRPNWRAAASYRRGVEYLAVLRGPVFSDGARTELRGLIGRRVELSATAGYATGASALSEATPFDTYTGEVRFRYALKRSVAAFSEYQYYFYDMRGQTGLAPDLPSVFEQQTVRVGLVLRIEALGK